MHDVQEETCASPSPIAVAVHALAGVECPGLATSLPGLKAARVTDVY